MSVHSKDFCAFIWLKMKVEPEKTPVNLNFMLFSSPSYDRNWMCIACPFIICIVFWQKRRVIAIIAWFLCFAGVICWMSWIFLRGQMPALWCLGREIGWTCMIRLERLLRHLYREQLISCCRKQKRRRPNRVNPPSGIQWQIQKLVLSSSLSNIENLKGLSRLQLVLLPVAFNIQKIENNFDSILIKFTLLYFNYFHFTLPYYLPLHSLGNFPVQVYVLSMWKRSVQISYYGCLLKWQVHV